MKRDVRILINTLHSSSPRRKCNCRMNEHLGVFATELRAKSKFVHGLLEVKLSECIIHGQTLTECKNRRNSIRIQLSAWSSTSSTQDKTTLNQIRRTNCFSWRYLTSQCLTKQQKTFQQTLKKWLLHCDLSRTAVNLQNHKLASIY